MENRTIKIHFTYITSILTAIIIGLVAVKWSEIPNLTELISFSLTLSSLLLAVIAIVYAIYSNSSFGRNIGKLDDASDNISVSAQDLKSISLELSAKIDATPDALSNLY